MKELRATLHYGARQETLNVLITTEADDAVVYRIWVGLPTSVGASENTWDIGCEGTARLEMTYEDDAPRLLARVLVTTQGGAAPVSVLLRDAQGVEYPQSGQTGTALTLAVPLATHPGQGAPAHPSTLPPTAQALTGDLSLGGTLTAADVSSRTADSTTPPAP